ncbi:MAG: IS66 family transposase [Candidatus Woesearchaeota archaeon]
MILVDKQDLQKKPKEELVDELYDSLVEIEKLKRELRKYKNAHTPSSANKHIKPSTVGLKAVKGAKRGAPIKHYGATLRLPPGDELIPVLVQQCGNCHSHNLVPTGYVKKRKVICLQKPKMFTKEYEQEEVRCLDCNSLTLANHQDIPEKGLYDNTIQSLVNYFRFKSRLPYNRIVDVMKNIFWVPMTEPTAMEITRRASNKLEPKYHELEEDIRKSGVVHADETSQSVNGVNYWVWVFCNTFMSLFKVHDKRGGDIVERTLGQDFIGKLVVDGWMTYKVYSNDHSVLLQRCWSHGHTEVKFECKEKHSDLYKWHCDIYEMVKKGKSYRQEKRRLKMFEKCKTQLALWVASAKTRRNLRKLATKIENGGDDWFTGVLHPEVPLDNNEAERSIRPWRVMEKIMGCLRSDAGIRTHEVLMSLVSTWEKQHKNVFSTLQAIL